MLNVLKQEALTFDDVILVPRYSEIDSRFSGEIDLSTTLGSLLLKYPIISANMDTVTGGRMADAINAWGGLGVPHRFMTPEEHMNELLKVQGYRIACIGVGESSRNRLEYIAANVDINGVLIDIAHGHCKAMVEQIKWVAAYCPSPSITIIAGNVATGEGAQALIEAGADVIKVGVGPGSLCTTRIKTGNGVPQLTAINNICEAIDIMGSDAAVIADGGIRSSGDIIKALAAGANAVMVGSLLAGTDETPGEKIRELVPDSQGRAVASYRYSKKYRGMASADAQKSWKGYVSSVEGESKTIACNGPVLNILEDLRAGLLSGMSYQNAHDIDELQRHCVFVRQTYYGHREGLPHGIE